MKRPLKVLHAPDYRRANKYQNLLAKVLKDHDVESTFPEGYHRILPITRMVRKHCPDILHLHWPEAYYTGPSIGKTLLRQLRFRTDLLSATQRCR